MVAADIAMKVTFFRHLDSHKIAHYLTRCPVANQTYLTRPTKPEAPVTNIFIESVPDKPQGFPR